MINKLLLNLFLAGVYVALAGQVTLLNLLAGLVIGMFVITLMGRAQGQRSYLRRVYGVLRFSIFFFLILIKANIEVAREILTPGFSMTPRILRYPVHGLSPVQITTLANAISLTPGTLSADIDDAGEVLYVHSMYADDRGEAIADLDQIKRWLLREVFDYEP
jgi:multicomponent Na+:H+ antiporter subunit E